MLCATPLYRCITAPIRPSGRVIRHVQHERRMGARKHGPTQDYPCRPHPGCVGEAHGTGTVTRGKEDAKACTTAWGAPAPLNPHAIWPLGDYPLATVLGT